MTTATGFNAIVGQRHPIHLLKTLIRNGTLPHALLFTGDDGVGKRSTAMALAMACNCRKLQSSLPGRPHLDAIDACGECIPCKKIAGNHHPDIIHIAPDTVVIKIDQIRSLLQTLMLKPNEADRRIVVLSDAQALNPEAGNALLKVLEEPPDRTLLVLTARQISDLLPTIVSRRRQIRFLPLPATDIRDLLMETQGVEARIAETVAGLCGGSYRRALKWVDPRWLRRREWIIEALMQVIDGGPEALLPGLALSEMLAKRKDRIEESLEIITMWLRDRWVAGVDPQRVLNPDHRDALVRAAGNLDPARLIEQIDAVDRARAALQSNTNIRLTLDAMVLQMAGAGSA